MDADFDNKSIDKQGVAAFVSYVRDEVRIHMNGIVRNVEHVSRADLPMELAENMQSIKDNSEAMLLLLDDVLDLAGIASGYNDIEETDYSIGTFVSSTKKTLENAAARAGAASDIEVDERLPFRLFGAGKRILHMTEKLIENAAGASHDGKISVKIKQVPGMNGSVFLRIEVADSGSGVLSQDMISVLQGAVDISDRNGDAAERLQAASIKVYLVRYYTMLMGGKLSALCKKDVGTTFTMLIPQKVVGKGRLMDYHTDGTEEAQSFSAPLARVLLVDKDAVSTMAFKCLLNINTMPDICQDIDVAISLMEFVRYDMIILGASVKPEDVAFLVNRETHERSIQSADMKIIAMVDASDADVCDMLIAGGVDEAVPQDDAELFLNVMNGMLPADKIEEALLNDGNVNFAEYMERLGIDYEYALENFNYNEDEFKDILRSLCRSSDTKKPMLRYYLEQGDIKNYIVVIHGTYGVAKMIGADWLARKLMSLEKAARQGQTDILKHDTDGVMDAFERLLTSIGNVIIPKDTSVAIKGAIEKDDLKETILKLKGYLDEYQIDEIEELFFTIAQFSYPDEEVVASIHAAEEHMINYRYIEVGEELDKILERLG